MWLSDSYESARMVLHDGTRSCLLPELSSVLSHHESWLLLTSSPVLALCREAVLGQPSNGLWRCGSTLLQMRFKILLASTFGEEKNEIGISMNNHFRQQNGFSTSRKGCFPFLSPLILFFPFSNSKIVVISLFLGCQTSEFSLNFVQFNLKNSIEI